MLDSRRVIRHSSIGDERTIRLVVPLQSSCAVISGSLIITEPWIPEDQTRREVAVVGHGLQGESLVLMCDVALSWNDAEPSRLVVVHPRHRGGSVYNSTKIYVNGAVWGGRDGTGLQFAGQLELEDVIPTPSDPLDTE